MRSLLSLPLFFFLLPLWGCQETEELRIVTEVGEWAPVSEQEPLERIQFENRPLADFRTIDQLDRPRTVSLRFTVERLDGERWVRSENIMDLKVLVMGFYLQEEGGGGLLQRMYHEQVLMQDEEGFYNLREVNLDQSALSTIFRLLPERWHELPAELQNTRWRTRIVDVQEDMNLRRPYSPQAEHSVEFTLRIPAVEVSSQHAQGNGPDPLHVREVPVGVFHIGVSHLPMLRHQANFEIRTTLDLSQYELSFVDLPSESILARVPADQGNQVTWERLMEAGHTRSIRVALWARADEAPPRDLEPEDHFQFCITGGESQIDQDVSAQPGSTVPWTIDRPRICGPQLEVFN